MPGVVDLRLDGVGELEVASAVDRVEDGRHPEIRRLRPSVPADLARHSESTTDPVVEAEPELLEAAAAVR